MDPSVGDSALRLALDTIARSHAGPMVRTQIGDVEQLRQRFQHSIEISVAVNDASPGPNQFTCFMHALELAPPPSLVAAIMLQFDGVIPGAEFIKQLIRLEWLIRVAEPEDGDILIYFDGDSPKHAGKSKDGIVESKWGLGHIWRHPIFEVPSSYGNRVQTFQRVDTPTATHWFGLFAESRVGAAAMAALARPDA
jgi:hypothetical protein